MVGEYKFGHDAARVTPEYLRSITEPDTGAVLTTGAIGKLASGAVDAREMFAKLNDDLADIERRIARLESARRTS
jgi:hypothetical protein